MMRRKGLDPWIAALALLLGMAWQGGLHAWQVMAASGLILVLCASTPQAWKPGRWTWALWAVAVLWQIFVSIKAQVSLDQLAWGFCLLAMGLTLRGQSRPGSASLRWIFALCCLAAASLLGSAAWSVWHDGAEPMARVHAFFPNQNLCTVAFFVPGLLIALAWIEDAERRWVALGGGGLLAAALIVAGSRGGWLALMVGAAWWLARAWQQRGFSRRLGLNAALVLGILAAAFLMPGSGLQLRAKADASAVGDSPYRYQRLQFWRASLLASAERPWFGWGQGCFSDAILRQDVGLPLGPRNPIARYRLVLEHAHNDLLEAAVDWGWPVASAILIVILAWIWERWRKDEGDPQAWAVEAFLVAMLAHSLVDMPFRPPFMQVEAVLALAWLSPAEPAGSARPAWPLRLALIAAFLLSLGAWLALPLKRDTGSNDPALAWRWSPAACLQPMDASLAARRAVVQGAVPEPWMAYFGWEDWDWVFLNAPPNTDREAQIHWLRRCVALRPFSVWQRLPLAQLEWQAGMAPEAEADLDSVLALEPNDKAAWQLRLEMAKAAKSKPAALSAQAEIDRITALKVPDDEANDGYVHRLISPVDSL